jgi:hypothetical protein
MLGAGNLLCNVGDTSFDWVAMDCDYSSDAPLAASDADGKVPALHKAVAQVGEARQTFGGIAAHSNPESREPSHSIQEETLIKYRKKNIEAIAFKFAETRRDQLIN